MADTNISKNIVDNCFHGVKSSWKQLFINNPDCKKSLIMCLNQIKEYHVSDSTFLDNLCPPLNKILETFKYFEMDQLKVIIIGQDPYYKAGVANGLCFSHNINNNCKKIQPSLKWIYQAIINNGYMSNCPDNGNLTYWVEQGVLLLNRYLTTITGKANQHKFWSDFTTNVVKNISTNCKDKKIFMLWGKHAQELEQYIDKNKHHVLTCGHPSPLARNTFKFENCTHFKDANNILSSMNKSEIDWNVPNIQSRLILHKPIESPIESLKESPIESPIESLKETIISSEKSEHETYVAPLHTEVFCAFTDGSAIGNGKKTCKAGSAFIILKKISDEYNIIQQYKVNVKDLIENIPTSSKSELIAMFKCLEYFVENLITLQPQELTIYCDNSYTVNVLTKWGDNWIATNTIHQKKNFDIIEKMINLRNIITENNTILNILHINSHMQEPKKDTNEWFKWYYNDMVDKLAKSSY